MSTVVMAIDGDTGPLAVLPIYQTMVRRPDRIILVHVRRPLPAAAQGRTLRETPDEAPIRIMQLVKQALENSGQVRVMTQLREGALPDEIIKVAENEQANLIIIGIGRSTGPLKLLTGRDIAEVERRTTVPVIVAPRTSYTQSAAHNSLGRKSYAA